MGTLAIVVLMIVVAVCAAALVILWDRLVGAALVGTAAGAMRIVARSKDRWWFWPVVAVAAVVVMAAFVTAVLVS